ncbi:MAG: diacylglycerol kinase family protein [bacterium]
MTRSGIEVIATTISGSIKDWGKVAKIAPLFKKNGRDDVTVHTTDSHAAARERTRDLVAKGATTIISAGGSGTFNAVLEGCIESGVGLDKITLGFLRKGSADLIGKALGMPDEIEEAIKVFAVSLAENRTVKCDVIRATSAAGGAKPRHFVGYGGAEIFGRIPHFTENRFIKYYKGILSQLFGDLGPFFVGSSLASIEKSLKRPFQKKLFWRISVDGREAAQGCYQAMIIVNGDLGPDLPFAKSVPLGSGDFYLFTLRDLGLLKLPGQFKHAFDSSIMRDPQRWGFESFRIQKTLMIEPDHAKPFPINVDGSTLVCYRRASFEITDAINLISRN